MKIPRDLSGKDLVKALRVLGYELVRQDGSHMRLTTHENGEFHVTVPQHRPLKVGTLKNILKLVAGHHELTFEELMRKLKI